MKDAEAYHIWFELCDFKMYDNRQFFSMVDKTTVAFTLLVILFLVLVLDAAYIDPYRREPNADCEGRPFNMCNNEYCRIGQYDGVCIVATSMRWCRCYLLREITEPEY